jgi:hypothetical protein
VAQGDLPTLRGGPLQRRKEKRQLEQLAQAAKRDGVAPTTATGHVRVIEDDLDAVVENQADFTDLGVKGQDPGSADDDLTQSRPSGFHVRAVPVDQPTGE